MTVNAGLLPPLESPPRDKREKKRQLAIRALVEMDAWITARGLESIATGPLARVAPPAPDLKPDRAARGRRGAPR